MADFVMRGLAAGLVPESGAANERGGVAIPVQDAPRRILYAAWPKAASPAASAFVALLREGMDNSLGN